MRVAAFLLSCSLVACSGSIDGDPVGGAQDDSGFAPGGDDASSSADGASDPCTARADGTYCGSKLGGDDKTLVTCTGGATSKTDACADGCFARSSDGHDDACGSDAVDPCFNDPDGDYCGSTIGGDASTLYHCAAKRTASSEKCPDGCADLDGATDKCASDAVDPCFNDGDGAYCGDSIGGPAGKVYHCVGKKTASVDDCGAPGCIKEPSGVADICNGVISCGDVQWWNVALTYGPYTSSSGWWDTDLAVSHDTPVILRHASRLDKHGVYGWGYMPEFTDTVTGKRFRYLHLRPQADKMLATDNGKIYPAGYVVGFSGGDTADTGKPTYSTGAHLCVQTLDTYRDCFPTGKDACK